MKILFLIFIAFSACAVEIYGLPNGISINSDEFIAGNDFIKINCDMVSRRLQDCGYLDADTAYINGKYNVAKGERYIANMISITKGGIVSEHICEIPFSSENIAIICLPYKEYKYSYKANSKNHTISIILTHNNGAF